ncbi:MAG: c-type cytochrome [Terracidiphilus sp.]|jgi:mono/diheme cytochrome c family protein
MVRILFGILLGIVLVALSLLGWLQFGKVPVAVADPPLPHEQLVTEIPLHARIERELVKAPVIQPDEESLVAGATIYRDQCAACHGLHGKPSTFGPHMFPAAPPLWEKHHHGDEAAAAGVIGVSDDPPGETYWKVANGIRLTGMPSFKGVLTDAEMWQVSLLVANADKPLPPAAVTILRGEPLAPIPVVVGTVMKKQ